MAESTTAEKDSEIPEDCDICTYAFTKTDRCPKIFPCGHTFCSHCINTLVMTNHTVCPKCGRPFEGRDANDFATHMAVIKKINQTGNDGTVKTNYESSEGNQFVEETNTLKEETEAAYQANLTRYANADLDIQKEGNCILELKESLLALNVDVRSIITALKEVEAQNIQTVFYLEGARQLLLDRQKVKTQRVKISEGNGMRISSTEDLATLRLLAQNFKELNQNAKEFEQDLKALIIDSEQNRISIQKDQNVWRENIDMIQAIPSFKEERGSKNLQMDLSQGFAEMKSGYDFPKRIKVDDLREMSDHIRSKIEEGKVFAWQPIEEQTNSRKEQGTGEEEVGEGVKVKKGGKKHQQRIGRLSLTNEEGLLLHHLTEEDSLPLNSYVVEYSDILQMVNPSYRETFLEFEIDKYVGRVFILCSPDTKLGRRFFLMCSGEMGTSYAGGKRDILADSHGHWRDERLHIDVNEKILDVDWSQECSKEVYQKRQFAGTVCEDSGGLDIHTKYDYRANLWGAFGKVYKGLEVVEKLCTFVTGQRASEFIDCRIKDCGVVIHAPY